MKSTSKHSTAITKGRPMTNFGQIVGAGAALVALIATGCSVQSADPGASSTIPAQSQQPLPANELAQAGQLSVCTSYPAPPFEFIDDTGNLSGVDVDLADAIAERAGLSATFQNFSFDTIIASLKSGKCDVAIASMNATAERREQIQQVLYFEDGESFMVAAGNPTNITDPGGLGLCGKRVVAELGSVDADLIESISQKCPAGGKPPVDIISTQNNAESLQHLSTGQADAFMNGRAVLNYIANEQSKGKFEVLPDLLEKGGYAVGIPLDHTGTTSALVAILDSLKQDGSLVTLYEKWGQPADAVPATFEH